MKIIARIHSGFATKFGVPRQSGVIPELKAQIVFEPEYRNPEALRGLDGFSHLWLLWQFSEAVREDWSPTVRPPRLGGNTRMGVFATRSPYRPNPIGLSSVRLEGIDWQTADGPVITVSGADLMDGTPIYDIKPYLAYTDSHPEATGGFITGLSDRRLYVNLPEELLTAIPTAMREPLTAVLSHDPRPTYQTDPTRVYGLDYGGVRVKFTVDGDTMTVRSVMPLTENEKE